ncbi:MAG: GNAT family N-acetyltransferase, partial [Fibrobacter sp.]|nr:GNAT family N-acetyltransferase [Fibrobacter sp.]
ICKKVPYCTFFHTPMWADIFCKSDSKTYRKSSRLVTFSDGKTALFPCVTKRVNRFIDVTISMPGATFGGWLSCDNLGDEHEKLLLESLYEYKDLIMRENPYNPILNDVYMRNAKDDSTQTVSLESGYEAVWKNSEQRHQRGVKTAIKKGVSVKEAVDIEDWAVYYEIYLKSIKRWERRKLFSGVYYERKFFDLIYKLNQAERKLFIAYVESKPVAGMLCFYWNDHAVMWHGAGLDEYFGYRPNNLLYDHAIHCACDSGFKWFDCNPSGGLDGVISFKKHLGAKMLKSRVVEHKSRLRTIGILVRK